VEGGRKHMGALDGKVAVVTGPSSGSGRGIAKRFVEEGASVVMLARGRERLEAFAAELGDHAVPIVTDVGDPDSVRSAVAEGEHQFPRSCLHVSRRDPTAARGGRW